MLPVRGNLTFAYRLSGVLAGLLLVASLIGVILGPSALYDAYPANAISTLLGLVYFIGFWSLRGQTPGMMPFTWKVVRADDGG